MVRPNRAEPSGTVGGLCDLLAVPARELLPDRLDHLPRARDDVERHGDVFAQLRQAISSAGRAGTGRRHDNTFARQVIGKRLPCGPLALKGHNRGGLGRCLLGDQIVLGGAGFELLELQLHLIEQATTAFGAGAILLALQLGDLQLEMGDQRFDGALVGHGVRELGRGSGSVLLGLLGSSGHARHQRLERFNIVRKRRDGGFHGSE